MGLSNAPLLISASTGSGKSYFVTYLLTQLDHPYTVIIDPVFEYRIPGYKILKLTPSNYKNALKSFPELMQKYRRIIVQFYMIPMDDQKKLVDYICACILSVGNTLVVIDEAHLYVPQTRPAQHAILLATTGRHVGVTPIYVTQRPQQLHTTIRSQTWFKVIGRHNDINDVKALKGFVPNVEIAAKLPKRWFLFVDSDSEVYIFTTEGLKVPHAG